MSTVEEEVREQGGRYGAGYGKERVNDGKH